MTSLKHIKFGTSAFPIQPGDTLTVKARFADAVQFKIKQVRGFTVYPENRVHLSDGSFCDEIILVENGFTLTHVNGVPFFSFAQPRYRLTENATNHV